MKLKTFTPALVAGTLSVALAEPSFAAAALEYSLSASNDHMAAEAALASDTFTLAFNLDVADEVTGQIEGAHTLSFGDIGGLSSTVSYDFGTEDFSFAIEGFFSEDWGNIDFSYSDADGLDASISLDHEWSFDNGEVAISGQYDTASSDVSVEVSGKVIF